MQFNPFNFRDPNPQLTGLLGPYYDPAEARRQALWGALTQAGLGLLGQGPSKTPIGFGDTLAAGFKGGIEGAQQGQQDYMKQGLLAQDMSWKKQDHDYALKKQAWEMTDHARQLERQNAQDAWAKGLPEADRGIAEAYPEAYASQYLQQKFGKAEDWVQLDDGSLMNKLTGETKPVGAPGTTGGGNLFDSKSVESRSLNYLIQIGKLTKEQAAQIGAGKPITGADGSMHFLTPQDIVGAAQQAGMPMGGNVQQPQPEQSAPMMNGGDVGAQTQRLDANSQMPQAAPLQQFAQRQQAGIPLGPAKKTEAQIKGEAIEAGAETSFDTAINGFDALASVWGSAAERMPGGMGRVFQSGEYQVARDAVKNVVANYIYALSGQQAPESEVERQVNITLPGPFDKPEAIAGKKQRLIGMIETIRSRAQGPAGTTPPDRRQQVQQPQHPATLAPGTVVRQADVPENTIVEGQDNKLYIKRGGRMVPYTGPLPGQ